MVWGGHGPVAPPSGSASGPTCLIKFVVGCNVVRLIIIMITTTIIIIVVVLVVIRLLDLSFYI